jgi:outer membrane protein TolC
MRQSRIFLALLGATLAAAAQTNAPPLRRLSLEDCLQIALQHNLDVKIIRYSPELARFTLQADYGAYDPSFMVSGEHDYARSPGGLDSYGRPYAGTESDANLFNTSLGGTLPWGTTYSFGAQVNDTYGTIPSESYLPGSVYTNVFWDPVHSQPIYFLATNVVPVMTRVPFESVYGGVGLAQFRQPLLKNFWINSARLTILAAKSDLKISELDMRWKIIQTVTAVEVAYDELILALENIKVQEKALQLAEQTLAENRKRVLVGAMAELDEKQAESQAASARASLLAAQARAGTQQRVLKNLLSDQYDEWKSAIVEPVDRLVAIPESFNLLESWRKSETSRPDLEQARLRVEKQGYTVRYAHNQLFPQLDLYGTAGYSASSTLSFNDALEQVGSRNNPYWTVGGQLTIPLGNITARNNYKNAKATKEQLGLVLTQTRQTILIAIEDAIATAQSDFQRVNATREARIYAEAALNAEQKKLDSGKSTSFEVLRLQRDLTAARSDEIGALASYNEDLARLAQQEGSTLERRKIKLELR